MYFVVVLIALSFSIVLFFFSSIVVRKMEVECPIDDVNDDCILHVLKFLSIEDALSFGCTNSRFKRITLDRFGQLIGVITIKLNFSEGSTREIIRIFGQQMQSLEIYFQELAVPADLFAIPSAIVDLRLCVVLRPIETGFPNEPIDDINVLDWVNIYQQSTVNILSLVNSSNGMNMGSLRFEVSINFDEHSYHQFFDYFRQFEGAVHWANVNLFKELRRGNIESCWHHIPDAYRFKFKLNFNF